MQNALLGTRVLITQATEFMGPVLCEVFAAQGAEVVASTPAPVQPRGGLLRGPGVSGVRRVGRAVTGRASAR